MIYLALLLYCLVCTIFLMASYFEGERDGGDWDIWRLVGLAFSLVWPLNLMIGLFAVAWSRPVSQPAVTPSHKW
ncbi:hypothetical protein D4A92_22830 (plasmid) [Rhizobium rosettiformans]|uniref:DUF2842 domain-containing protein n=1 Tax=Rhizobium rosettiformans TaxID=1368430 RepID=A0ABX7F240_9HYPH|nr:hypothetical protein [Rhizobium rosettiformans]QRF54356.1 hypothetical protein D4A92_22830 [Rhizobium rosettiformans]